MNATTNSLHAWGGIQKAIVRCWHLIDDDSTIHYFSDHKALLGVFNPDSPSVRGLALPGRYRLVRVAAFMAEIPHELLKGELNTYADLFSRLAKYPVSPAEQVHLAAQGGKGKGRAHLNSHNDSHQPISGINPQRCGSLSSFSA